ncbi:Glycosyltransferase involved in cell wall bisynthesis [Bryocella elongata]|uniref:Glycosyltransferase involved in cell wall bisynthesis n=1 Tax=Bryocella elongata TaxID=863522 RepID=A0A1H5WG04_9BACT|nr:glycosyltransferase family 2 protein [Bryocella elongata]SEF98303.1 Glycosyltransferase involved in cell wall bisynthesis [Bryocella elongata]
MMSRTSPCLGGVQLSPRRVTSLGPGLPGLVSIIIPTYRRVKEMREAALSALAQTYPNVEVIVVADGPDPDARAAVEGIDARLRYFELEKNSGPAEARNRGVRMSRGEWLAFLDDDDLVLPERVERCIAAAQADRPNVMIACRTIYRRDGKQDDVWPQRPIGPDEDVSEYILVRPSLLGRPGVIPVQALMVHRSIFEIVPFTTHRDHEDWAWLLEAWNIAGARVEFVWEPLVIYNIVTESISRSRRMNWRDSLHWANRYRKWLTPRAYNSFLATKVALKAKRAGELKGVAEIFMTIANNRPRPLDILFVAGVALLPNVLLQAAWKRSLSSGESHETPAEASTPR